MMDLKNKKALAQTAVDAADGIEPLDIILWAQWEDGGGLPDVSARAFGYWLNENWNEWTEDPEATVKSVLEGAVSDWCGGRTI